MRARGATRRRARPTSGTAAIPRARAARTSRRDRQRLRPAGLRRRPLRRHRGRGVQRRRGVGAQRLRRVRPDRVAPPYNLDPPAVAGTPRSARRSPPAGRLERAADEVRPTSGTAATPRSPSATRSRARRRPRTRSSPATSGSASASASLPPTPAGPPTRRGATSRRSWLPCRRPPPPPPPRASRKPSCCRRAPRLPGRPRACAPTAAIALTVRVTTPGAFIGGRARPRRSPSTRAARRRPSARAR